MDPGDLVMKRQDCLRFALIGCGEFGRFLAALAQRLPRIAVTALCSRSQSSVDQAKKDLGAELPGFTSVAELISRAGELFDAVMICSANYEHCGQAVAAARAGKHIYCEKAMALTTDECWQMVEAAERAGVRLMVGHKRRLRPPFARLKELCLCGALGDPVAMQISSWHHYPAVPRWWMRRDQCGGLLHRVGVHDVDFMRAILGDVETVSAVSARKVTGEADYDECMAVLLRFRSGTIGSLQAGFRFGPLRFRESCAPWVQCTRGGIRMAMFQDHIDLFWGADPEHLTHERFDDLGHDAAYRGELSSFADWVLDGKTPVLSWEEGLRCVEVMEAAYRSAELGGQPVTLPLLGR